MSRRTVGGQAHRTEGEPCLVARPLVNGNRCRGCCQAQCLGIPARSRYEGHTPPTGLARPKSDRGRAFSVDVSSRVERIANSPHMGTQLDFQDSTLQGRGSTTAGNRCASPKSGQPSFQDAMEEESGGGWLNKAPRRSSKDGSPHVSIQEPYPRWTKAATTNGSGGRRSR